MTKRESVTKCLVTCTIDFSDEYRNDSADAGIAVGINVVRAPLPVTLAPLAPVPVPVTFDQPQRFDVSRGNEATIPLGQQRDALDEDVGPAVDRRNQGKSTRELTASIDQSVASLGKNETEPLVSLRSHEDARW